MTLTQFLIIALIIGFFRMAFGSWYRAFVLFMLILIVVAITNLPQYGGAPL